MEHRLLLYLNFTNYIKPLMDSESKLVGKWRKHTRSTEEQIFDMCT